MKSNLLSLSIFIICKNEAHIIEDTLRQAAKLADEIILVDSGSVDATIDIAKRYATKIYTQEWLGYAKQKNYALSLCKHKWVLSLDADEVLTDRLIEEIKNLFESGQYKKSLGFKIPRRLFIGKQLVKYGGFYPDYQLRLFEKGFGRFQDLPVHESVELWDVRSSRSSAKIISIGCHFNIAWSCCGNYIATGNKYDVLAVLDARMCTLSQKKKIPYQLNELAWTYDSNYILAATGDDRIGAIDIIQFNDEELSVVDSIVGHTSNCVSTNNTQFSCQELR